MLTKAILIEAEAILAEGRTDYICHAIAKAAGEPLSCFNPDAIRPVSVESEALLNKLGVELGGSWFALLAGSEVGGYASDSSEEKYRATRFARIVVLRIMQTMVPE